MVLEAVDDSTPIADVKRLLSEKLGGDTQANRVRLARWGCELDDSQLLRTISSAREVCLEMQIRRRELPRLSTADRANPTAASRGCRVIRLRVLGTPCNGIKLEGLSEQTEIRTIRSMVAKMPITKELVKARAIALAEANANEKKKAASSKEPGHVRFASCPELETC